jgi:hypothetical protein
MGSDGKPLLRVVRLDATTQAHASPALATFAGMIDLASARVEPATPKPGDEIRIYLTWRGRQKMTDDYTIFAHVRRGASETVAQHDAQPGMGRSPTGRWVPGDRVLDEIPITIPAGTAPGELRIVIGFYRVLTLDRLHVDVNGAAVAGDEVEIGRITVMP